MNNLPKHRFKLHAYANMLIRIQLTTPDVDDLVALPVNEFESDEELTPPCGWVELSGTISFCSRSISYTAS